MASDPEKTAKATLVPSEVFVAYPACFCGHRYDHHQDPGDTRGGGCYRCACASYEPAHDGGGVGYRELVGRTDARGVKVLDVVELLEMSSPPSSRLDYKELLKKYIAHVGNCEGVDFIYATHREPEGDSSFSDAEWAALRALAGRGEEDEYERETWREKLADHAEGEATRRVDAQTFARAELHTRECRVALRGTTLVEVSTLGTRYRSWTCPCGAMFRAEGNG